MTPKAKAAAKLKAELTDLVVAYKRAEQWGGIFPNTVVGADAKMMWMLQAETEVEAKLLTP